MAFYFKLYFKQNPDICILDQYYSPGQPKENVITSILVQLFSPILICFPLLVTFPSNPNLFKNMLFLWCIFCFKTSPKAICNASPKLQHINYLIIV